MTEIIYTVTCRINSYPIRIRLCTSLNMKRYSFVEFPTSTYDIVPKETFGSICSGIHIPTEVSRECSLPTVRDPSPFCYSSNLLHVYSTTIQNRSYRSLVIPVPLPTSSLLDSFGPVNGKVPVVVSDQSLTGQASTAGCFYVKQSHPY